MNLILFGFKRCGKTFFGKKVATALNRPFFDTDILLENLFEASHGKKLLTRDIFKQVGPMTFRALEAEVLNSLQDVQSSIIAIGGGAILDPLNADVLLKMGKMIYIDVPKAIIKERMLSGELPAYLNPNDPDGSFEVMYEERKPLYEKIHAERVETDAKTPQQIVEKICSYWETKNGK